MNAATGFLALVGQISEELDVETIRRDLDGFRRQRPELSTRRQAERLIRVTARRAAVIGFAASLPEGWAVMGPELAALAILESRMIIGLHLLYESQPETRESVAGLALGFTLGAGLRAGRLASSRSAERLLARFLPRRTGAFARGLVPLAGAAVAAALNLVAVLSVGTLVHRSLLERYGPPDVPGTGPALETEGSVA